MTIYSRVVINTDCRAIPRHRRLEIGIWSLELKDKIISVNGSLQDIPEIPQELKDIDKTAWEIKQKNIIDMAADRGAFICQSQRMNVFMRSDVNFAKLTSMHFHAWKSGLKTGMYYLRTRAAANEVKFTIAKQADVALSPKTGIVENTEELSKEEALAQMACSLDNPDACEACGS